MLINSGTLPWAFLLDNTCNVDMVMTGFGMRDSTQFVVAGHFSLQNAADIASDCSKLTPATGSGTVHNFVSSQSVSGLVYWYKVIPTTDVVFSSMSISTDNVLVGFVPVDKSVRNIKVIKLSISTGAWAAEMRIDTGSVATGWIYPSTNDLRIDNVKLFRSQYTSSTIRNYAIFQSDTNGATAAGNQITSITKFDENFVVSWQRALNADLTTPFAILDFDVSTKTGKFSASIGYQDLGSSATSDKQRLTIFNETTGETLDEYEFVAIQDVTIDQGAIRIYPDDTGAIFAFHLRMDTKTDAVNRQVFIATAALNPTTFVVTTGVKMYATTIYGSSPQLEIIPTSQNGVDKVVFTVVQEPYRIENHLDIPEVRIYLITSFATNQLTAASGHQTIRRVNTRGSSTFSGGRFPINTLYMRYYSSTTKSSALYLAYNAENLFSQEYPARIMYFKINPSTQETYSAECGSGSAETFAKYDTTTFTRSTTRITNVADDASVTTNRRFNQTSQKLGQSGGITSNTDVTDLVSTTSLTSLKPVVDGHLPENAIIGVSSTPSGTIGFTAVGLANDNGLKYYQVSIPEGSTGNNTYSFRIAEQGCRPNTINQYTCTEIVHPNGTSVNLNLTQMLQIRATSTSLSTYNVGTLEVRFPNTQSVSNTQFVKSYVGSRTLRLTCSFEVTTTLPNQIAQPYVRYNIEPSLFSDFSDDEFSDPTDCSSPAFPIFFGHDDGNVRLNYLGEDQSHDNIIMAGSANTKPFAPADTLSQGFIALYNSFGAPHWIYYVRSSESGKESECYHASESDSTQGELGLVSGSGDTVVFGVCKVWDQEYQQYRGVVVALSYLSGAVRYARFLPRDLFADYNGDTNFDDFNSPIFVTEVYPQSFAGDLLIVQEYYFEDSTYTSGAYSHAVMIFNIDGTRKFYDYLITGADDDRQPVADIVLNTQQLDGLDGSFFMATHGQSHNLYRVDPYNVAVTYPTNFPNRYLFADSAYRQELTVEYSAVGNGFWQHQSLVVIEEDYEVVVSMLNTDYNYVDVFTFDVEDLDTNPNERITLSSCVSTDCPHIYWTSVLMVDVAPAGQSGGATLNYYHYLISGPGAFLLLVIPHDFSTVVYQRVWENGDAAYDLVGSVRLFDGISIAFGAVGYWGSNANSSSLIFRLGQADLEGDSDVNDYSCVAFRDIKDEELLYRYYDLYFSVDLPASSATYSVDEAFVLDTDYDTALLFENEWLQDANAVNFLTSFYAEPYEWGFNLIPGVYDFRVPQLRQQCGAYSRQSQFEKFSVFQLNEGSQVDYNGDGLDQYVDYGDQFADYVRLTLGQVGFVQLVAPELNCQGRPLDIIVYSAGNTSQAIEQTWITYDKTTKRIKINAGRNATEKAALNQKTYQSPARMLIEDDMGFAEPGSFALVIRYQDSQDPNSFWDHSFQVVILPVEERVPDELYNNYECYQNPYPTSFGGCDNGGCQMTMFDFQELASPYSEAGGYRTDIVISGMIEQDASFMNYPYANQADAFLIKINDVVIPQWFTIFSFSRDLDDAITAVAAVNGQEYAYAFLTTDPLGTLEYEARQSAILKIDLYDGLMNSQYSLNLYHKTDGALIFHDVRQIYDSNIAANVFAFSFVYSTQIGYVDSNRIGTLRIRDVNGNNAVTAMPWTIEEFHALRQDQGYEYVVGMHSYNVPGDSAYYEAHLAQPPNGGDAYMYLLHLDWDDDTSDMFDWGLKVFLSGNLRSSQALQPKIVWDVDAINNLYSCFATDSNAYLLKYNFTADPNEFSVYTFTGIVNYPGTDDIVFEDYNVDNIDMIYKYNSDYSVDYFLVVMNLIDTGSDTTTMYFFQIQRLDFTLTTSTYIRMDTIAGSQTFGKLAFPIPYPDYLDADYFYYVKNVPSFANTGTNEVLINRKAFLFSRDNKYDCQASEFIEDDYEAYTSAIGLVQYSGGSACTMDQTALEATGAADPTQDCVSWISLDDTLSTQFLFYDKTELYEDGDFVLWPSPYVNQVQMKATDLNQIWPQQQTITGAYGFGTEECSAGTGIQRPTTMDLAAITKLIGEDGTVTINRDSFMQCQGLDIEFNFLYEDGKTTQNAENVFVNFTQSTGILAFDLDKYRPSPGIRLFQFKANTIDDDREVIITQPFVILPEDYDYEIDDAPVSVTLPLDCIADNEYPKIVGELQYDFTHYGSDIHAASGNLLLCGQAEANAYPNSHWAQTTPVALNMLSNLAGRIFWSYSVTYIPTSVLDINGDDRELSYKQCQFADDEHVFSLLQINGDSYNSLVLVKQSFAYGTYVYAKLIPGEYTKDTADVYNYVGFSLIFYDVDLDPDNNNSQLFAYVFGHRDDIDQDSINHFSKIYMQDTDYPYQVWTAYSVIDGHVSGSIQKTGASTNSVYALSHLEIDYEVSQSSGGEKFANIVKYDAESGEQQESVTYPADLDNPDISFVVDYPYDLIYLSAATYDSASTSFKKYLKRFDLFLVPDNDVMFTMSLTSIGADQLSDVKYVSALAFNTTHLFETFSFVEHTYYVVVYLRQTLKALSFIQFHSTQVSIENLGLNFFWNGDTTVGPYGQAWLLHIQTSSGFLSEDKLSAVITRLNYTDEGVLLDPNSCLDNYYTDLSSTVYVVGDTVNNVQDDVAIESFDTTLYHFFYRPTYYKLQPQQFLYFEQKVWPEQISYQPALAFECRTPGLVFPEELQHQIITLPMNRDEDRTYSFYLPEVCDLTQLTVTISVDGYSTLPSFLSGSKETTPEGNFYRIVFKNSEISDADAGIYNIQLLLRQNDNTASSSFILSIYPTVAYGDDVESFACEDKYNFMSYGHSLGTIFTNIDLDVESQDYVLCGANKPDTNVVNGVKQYQAFVQLNTQGHATKWHMALKSGTYDNIAQFCAISEEIPALDNERVVYTVVNSENENQVSLGKQMNNSIYIFQHSLSARFKNAKQIQNVDSNSRAYQLQAEGFELDSYGNLYVSGTADGYALSHNSLGFFIFKLDPLFNLAFYSVFDFGRTPVGGELLFSEFASSGPHRLLAAVPDQRIFSIFGYLSDTEDAYRWGILSLDAIEGEVKVDNDNRVSTTLANSTTISRNSTRNFYQQGLLLNNAQTYLYSCLIYKASEDHDEIALTEHDPDTLEPTANLEFSRGYIPLEACHIQEQSDTGLIVMAIGTFEYTHIFAFEAATDDNNNRYLTNISHTGLAYYHQRFVPFKIQMFETVFQDATKNYFSLYIRTMGFDANDDLLFITKFADVETPEWSSPCTASEIQFTTTSTFYLSMNSDNSGVGIDGIPVNAISKWTTLDYAFKQVSNLTLNGFYSKNPQKFVQTIDTADDHVYRSSFLNCSRYSFPTSPETIVAEGSQVESLTSQVTVGSVASVISLNPFMSCSYDDITHEIVYQDDTTIATFLDFNDENYTLTVNANSNEYAGYYLLRYRAYVTEDPTFVRNVDFVLTVETNEPPFPVLDGFTDDFNLYTGHTQQWTVNLDFDIEGDEAIFDAILLDTTGTEVIDSTWFSVVSSNSTTIVFQADDAPLNDQTNGDQYYINVSISDQFNVETPRTYQISVKILPNTAPTLDFSRKQLQLPIAFVAVDFEFNLVADDFIDAQGDAPFFYCNILSTKSNSWITLVQNSTSLTFSGKAPSNDYASTYYFVCAVTDQYLPTLNFYQFVLEVSENNDIVQTNIASVSLLRNDFHIWSDLNQACVDPEDQPIIRTISIMKGATAVTNLGAAGFSWDEDNVQLAFYFTQSTQAGTYTISMTCDDDYNVPLNPITFTLIAVDNEDPVVTTYTIANPSPLAGLEAMESPNPIIFDVDISGLFTDPEGEELYYDVVDNSDDLFAPTTLIAQVQGEMLRVTIIDSTTASSTTFNLKIRAYDPVGNVASVPFSITIFACHSSCLTCSGQAATQCLTCQSGTPYFYNKTTSDITCSATQCPTGSYSTVADPLVCETCPDGCTECSGPDAETQCSVCDTPSYYNLLDTDEVTVIGCTQFCVPPLVLDGDTCVTATETAEFLECQAFINNFTTTTSEYFVSFDQLALEKETVTCAGTATWTRVFSAQCRKSSSSTDVYIQIATDSRPPHCLAQGVTPASEEIAFELLFSVPSTKTGLTQFQLSSQQSATQHFCNSLDWTSIDLLTAKPLVYGYVGTPQVPLGIVGVSINGVPIHAGTSEKLEDWGFPVTSTKRITVDECLGAITANSDNLNTFYHYYTFSPCLFFSTLSSKTQLSSCASLTNCQTDPIKYGVVLNYPASLKLRRNFAGIALDGHMISGPFITDNVLFQPCDVDICNGYLITAHGRSHYVYASTLFYPYTVGCWGPGNGKSTYTATCSNNNNVCVTGSYSVFGYALNLVFILFVSLLMFY